MIAEQVALALAGEFVPFAVNVDVAEVDETIRPYVPLAEELGAIFAGLVDTVPATVDVELSGAIATVDVRIAVLAAVKGILKGHSAIPVSYVNAMDLAHERGLEVRTITGAAAQDHVSVIRLAGGGHTVAGRVSSYDHNHVVTEVDGIQLEIRPAANMLVLRNYDEPGMVGMVGSTLGDAGVNISNMHIGESGDGVDALMFLTTSAPVPPAVQDALRADQNVRWVKAITLP
jgi:D-3-phosphoglycerate dehydrogenase